MRMVLLLAAVVLAAISVFVFLNYSMFLAVETADCRQDPSCAQDLETKMAECVPSSTIIEGRDGIVLMVNITREGEKCVRTETVLDAPESSYLVGHNVTCESNLSQLDDPESLACPGSLYDYVKPSGGGGGGSSGPAPPPRIPELNCGIDDNECKDLANQYLLGCTNSKIINTDIVWYPTGYWTTLTNISRQVYNCWLYFEVLNAVNLPPGIPSNITGINMTCNVPLSAFPISNFTSEWCSGELFDYLQYFRT
jgi:hypothetical protein